jgi:hypothetical protein
MPTSDDVRRAVTNAFPPGQQDGVTAALKRYRGPEGARVRLAILALADGDAAEVDRMVRAANGDYRDVLLWAEEPAEAGTGTKRGMAARYRRLGVRVPEELRPPSRRPTRGPKI